MTRARGRRALVATLLLASLPSVSRAQRLRGEIVLPDSISPAAHVIVIATDATGADVARTTSGESGAFDFLLPHSGPYRVRVLRLGFRPTVLAPLEIAAEQVRTLRIVLAGSIVSLSQVRVRSQSVCGVREDSGQLVADLWQQARFALLSTEIPDAGQPTETTAISYERTLDPLGVSVRAESSTVVRAATSRLFASLPADSLARVGYVSEDKTGVVYRAPDAGVLLSQSFVALHCFAAVPPPEAHPDWVGLAVTPAKARRNISDIDGTLWLDRATAELRLFEYRYTGVPEEVARAGAGGRVEFARLRTGDWIVNRWDVRMPRTVLTRSAAGLGTWAQTVVRPTVLEIHLRGGEVLEVDRAGVALYRSAGAAEATARVSAPKAGAGVLEPAAEPAVAGVRAGPIGETVLRGRITENGDTSRAIVGAEIELVGTALRRFANSEGRYQFRDLAPGSYQVRVRRLGYLPSSERVVLDSGSALSYDVALKRPTNMLTAVQVRGRTVKVPARYEDVYQRGARGFGTFFTKEDIDRLKPLDTPSLFYSIPGVHVHTTGDLEFMRCQEREHVQVYVDGVQLTHRNTVKGTLAYNKLPKDGQEAIDESFSDSYDILRDVSPTSIQAMEVYTGVAQIPAEFLDDACAVIAIWTKSY